jgi:hypothetical protein
VGLALQAERTEQQRTNLQSAEAMPTSEESTSWNVGLTGFPVSENPISVSKMLEKWVDVRGEI